LRWTIRNDTWNHPAFRIPGLHIKFHLFGNAQYFLTHGDAQCGSTNKAKHSNTHIQANTVNMWPLTHADTTTSAGDSDADEHSCGNVETIIYKTINTIQCVNTPDPSNTQYQVCHGTFFLRGLFCNNDTRKRGQGGQPRTRVAECH